MMKRIIIFLWFFGFTSLCWLDLSVADDEPHYEIDVTISATDKKLSAEQTVIFINKSDQSIDQVFFHIYPNRVYTQEEKDMYMRYASFFKVDPFPEGFQTPGFKVKYIRRGGKNLPFTIEGEDQTLLKVKLSEWVSSNEEINITIGFDMTLPYGYGRLGIFDDIMALSRWYPILSVQTDQGWSKYPFYPFHRPFFSDAATYDVRLKVESNQNVIHSGHLVSESHDQQYKFLNIKTELPMREFTMALSSRYQEFQKDVDGVKIRSFFLPGYRQQAKSVWESARDMINFYTELFGPYPYKEFSIAPVHLGYGGEQMGGMIFVDTRVYKLPDMLGRYRDFLIAHETGHQWLFNIIGVDEYKELWLDEGVNSFFLLEYLERKYGADAEILDFPSWFEPYEWIFPTVTFKQIRDVRYKLIARLGFDSPVLGRLSSFKEPSSIFSLTYGKGSRVVGLLRDRIGEEAFKKTFKQIYDQYKFKNLSVDEFISIAEEQSEEDLSDFFDQWLRKKGVYDAAVNIKHNQIVLTQKGEVRFPTEVLITKKDGTQQEMLWSQEENAKKIIYENKDTIESIEIDPKLKHLDIDRTNNRWPRKIKFYPVPYYWPFYDTTGILPDDHYNLVVGPELGDNGFGVKAGFLKPYEYEIYTSSGYEFSEEVWHSDFGLKIRNLFQSPTTFGAELSHDEDLDDGDDLLSAKIYLRWDLWPLSYGILEENDHISLYLIRNHALSETTGNEPTDNVSYKRNDEAIVGLSYHRDRATPYPSPNDGYEFDWLIEKGGHFMGAEEDFSRTMIDGVYHIPLEHDSSLALRLKTGLGYPSDKNLFELGGPYALRGYGRKDLRGANMVLAVSEFRFPIMQNIDRSFLNRWLTVSELGGVVFYEAGQSWYDDFGGDIKQDAGIGLRLTVDVASFIEKVIIRMDIAQPINDDTEDTPRVWFGLGHAF